MKIKPTFFNTRKERLWWNYTDINNYLFTIFFDSGAEVSFVLRDLKKDKTIIKHIYSKINSRFSNVSEVFVSDLSIVEYNTLKQKGLNSVIKIC
jgi:hypothetical protein